MCVCVCACVFTETCSAGSFVGTAQYVSPELLNDKQAGKPSDIWALGTQPFARLICLRLWFARLYAASAFFVCGSFGSQACFSVQITVIANVVQTDSVMLNNA